MTHPAPHIVLVGMMGCGKTRIGSALARRIGWRFLDLDAVLEIRGRRSIATLFAEEGEPAFRRRESRMLARLLKQRPSVIATGGGAFLAPVNRQLIDRTGISVHLAAHPRILWHRIAGDVSRPLIAGADGQSSLVRLARARRPVYTRASMTVWINGGDRPAALVDRICSQLAVLE